MQIRWRKFVVESRFKESAAERSAFSMSKALTGQSEASENLEESDRLSEKRTKPKKLDFFIQAYAPSLWLIYFPALPFASSIQ